ncbi:MAG: glycoside hydrolase family 28 protein [Chitinophagaceae bacterium]|nr:glycoside hydrolase family 28 protein [Chitinophagaceae bacterium]
MKKICSTIVYTFVVLVCFLHKVDAQKLPPVQQTKFKKDTFNIKKFGAVADGITLNTIAINKAINACSKKGGGVVLVPGGFWLTGPIVLQSNTNLHIVRDAVLQFTSNFDQYPLIEGNWEGLPSFRNQSPISATNATNIAITGSGIVDGNGDAWRMVKKEKLTESQWKNKIASGGVVSDDKKTWFPSEKSIKGNKIKNAGVIMPGVTKKDVEEYKDFLRPNLVVLSKCKTVLLEGVTFQNSPAWNLHPLMCEDLTVRNVYVKNPWYAQNGDGIDIESCKNFIVENSTFDVGDDGICIKSGRDAEGRKRGMPTENGIIRNCVVYHAHGGFVIGSEMSGGAKNLYVSNCTFIGTDIGLRFKTTRGRGGVVEKIYINNISMKDIAGEAILFDMYYAAKDPVPLAGEKREPPVAEFKTVDETTPVFKDFYVSNIVCNGAEKAIFIRGIPEMHIKNINLENMVLQANKGIDIQEGTGVTIKNTTLVTKETNPIIYVLNSENIVFDKISYNAGAELLLQVQGERTGSIKLLNTDASKSKKKLDVSFGAKEENVTMK